MGWTPSPYVVGDKVELASPARVFPKDGPSYVIVEPYPDKWRACTHAFHVIDRRCVHCGCHKNDMLDGEGPEKRERSIVISEGAPWSAREGSC